jgi:PAS domain S-box-containing protein
MDEMMENENNKSRRGPRYFGVLSFIPTILLFFFCLLCSVFATPSSQNDNKVPLTLFPLGQETPTIILTKEEQAWLKAHPEIILGTATSYPPMVIKLADGTHIGMLVDIFEQINLLLDTTIGLHIEDSWSDAQEKAKKGEIDGLALGGKDPERDALYNATDTIITTYYSIFARSQNEFQIKSFSDLNGMRIGNKKGAGPAKKLLDKLPSAIIKTYDSHESMTQALLNKEIDFIIAWMSYDHWRKDKLQRTVDNILLIDEYPIEMFTHIRKDWPELIPILNKAIAVLQRDPLPRIINKWFGQWPQSYTDNNVILTPKNRDWLANHQVLRIGLSANSLPLSTIDENGNPYGIIPDYFRLLGDYTGLSFEFYPMTFSEVLTAARERKIDLFASVVTPERKEYAFFSDPLFSIPFAIITRQDMPFIGGLGALQGKNSSVLLNSTLHRHLEESEPQLELVPEDSVLKCLKAVSEGRVDVYIGDAFTASQLINQEGFVNLKFDAPTDLPSKDMSIAVRNDWPEMAGILDSFTASISQAERNEILNKWLTVHFEHSADYSLLWKILLGIVLTALAIIYWNRLLHQQVRKRTAELSKSDSRFRATFEQAAVGIAHASLDGHFIRVNQKFCDIVGYSRQEMMGLKFQEISYVDDRENDLEHLNELLAGESSTYSLEKRYIHKNRNLVWVHLTVSLVCDEGGQPQWFVGVIKDICERKQAQEALLQSEEQFKGIFNSMVDVFARADLDGNCLLISPSVFNVIGYVPEEVMGRNYVEFYTNPKEWELLKKRLLETGRIQNVENEVTKKDGSKIIISSNAKIINDDSGKPVFIESVFRDITESKQAKEDFNELREEYTHMARVSAMGELSASLAHELKQPLAAIRTNAQAALRFLTGDKPDIDELHEVLKDIIDDNRRADDVITRIRAFMRKGELQTTELNLKELVQDILPLVKSLETMRQVSLQLEFDDNIPLGVGDRIQMQQVVLNLILNSTEALMDAKVKSGKIILRTHQEDTKYVILSVSDNGPGIIQDVMETLFEPFNTTKPEGLGMGLAISRSIVEEHGGRLWAENNTDGGATFSFTVPVARGVTA